MYSYKDVLAEVLIDEETLQKRVQELADEISRDYEGKDLVLVCFLRGGVVFLVDLMRKMEIPHSIEFMAISSYGAGRRESSGHVRVDFDLKTDIRGKEVLISTPDSPIKVFVIPTNEELVIARDTRDIVG